MLVSRMTEKGQITIPKELRENMGLRPGDQVEFRAIRKGLELRKQVKPGKFSQYKGFLGNLKGNTSRNTMPISHPIFGPSLNAPQSKKPQHSQAMPRLLLNRSVQI